MSGALIGGGGGGGTVEVPDRSVAVWRGNVKVVEYTQGLDSSASYGQALFNANAASQSGDTVVCSGGGVAAVSNFLFDKVNVRYEFNGLTLKPADSAWTFLVKFIGSNCEVHGLIVDGNREHTLGSTSNPFGMVIDADNILVDDCEVNNVMASQQAINTGGATWEASGEGLVIDGDNCTVTNFRATGNDYNAIATYGDYVDVRGAKLVNNRRGFTVRARTINGGAEWRDLDTIRFTDVDVYVDQRGTDGPEGNSAECNWNTGGYDGRPGGWITSAYMTNCTFVNVQSDSGVEGRQTAVKVQNCHTFTAVNCVFDPGDNRFQITGEGGPSFSKSFAFEANYEPEVAIFRNCTFGRSGFSGGTAGGPLKKLICEGCTFGSQPATDGIMFYQIGSPYVRFSDCIFNLNGDTQRVFDMEQSTNQQSLQQMVVERCRFIGHSTNSLIDGYIQEPSYQYVWYPATQWFNNPSGAEISCKLIAYDNVIEQAGTQNMTWTYPTTFGSATVQEQTKAFVLMSSTDRNGNILFDDTNQDHLDVYGAGANGNFEFFSSLPVTKNGAIIRNVNWTPDGTQIVSEKAWISHDGVWKEYHANI